MLHSETESECSSVKTMPGRTNDQSLLKAADGKFGMPRLMSTGQLHQLKQRRHRKASKRRTRGRLHDGLIDFSDILN